MIRAVIFGVILICAGLTAGASAKDRAFPPAPSHKPRAFPPAATPAASPRITLPPTDSTEAGPPDVLEGGAGR